MSILHRRVATRIHWTTNGGIIGWPLLVGVVLCLLLITQWIGWYVADQDILLLQRMLPQEPPVAMDNSTQSSVNGNAKVRLVRDGQPQTRRNKSHSFLEEINKEPEQSQQHQQLPSFSSSSYNNPRRISLIVVFRGELGNQLSVLAWARRIQLLGLAANPPIHIELIGQLIQKKNEIRGRDDLVRCFPEFRSFNFNGGIYDEDFLAVQILQEKWLSEKYRKPLVNMRQLTFLEKLLARQAAGAGPPIPNTTRYSLPYLTVSGYAFPDVLEDSEELYHDLRHWFRFDEAACCHQIPDADEIVFHYRNFLAELGRERAWGTKYTEVTPETAARYVFQNHFNDTRRRRRVAIVSRTVQGLESYVEALQREQGISARIIAGQSGVQDFCFIAKARAEFVSSKQSTFARWASLLGNVTVTRHYRLNRQPETSSTGFTVNSTNRRRIISEKHIFNRTFIEEEYWQPDLPLITVNDTGNA